MRGRTGFFGLQNDVGPPLRLTNPGMSVQPVERYFLIYALAIAVVGAVNDVRGARIPNWLTYSGLVSALLVRSIVLGWAGLKGGLVGLLIAGGIFFFLFLLGGMGGGDVKLMAAVGAWVGSHQAMSLLAGSAVAGGILAVWYVLAYKHWRQTVLNAMALAQHHLTSGFRPHPVLNIRESSTLRIPYGLAVAVGTFYCVGKVFWWR